MKAQKDINTFQKAIGKSIDSPTIEAKKNKNTALKKKRSRSPN
jgi:hypothetical protein